MSQVSSFTWYYALTDMFYISPLVSMHTHSCKVKKGHSATEKGEDSEQIGHIYPGREEKQCEHLRGEAGAGWGSAPQLLNTSDPTSGPGMQPRHGETLGFHIQHHPPV